MNWNDIFDYRDGALYWRIKPGKGICLDFTKIMARGK